MYIAFVLAAALETEANEIIHRDLLIVVASLPEKLSEYH